MQKALKIKDDEVSIYDFLTKQMDWDAMDKEKRNTIELVLFALLSCVDGKKIDVDKLARITSVVSGGEMKFSG